MSESPAVYGAVNIDPWGKKKIGDWIQTYTGKKFHLLDPHHEDFCIEDVAHALSNQCRFTGHVKEFYSVGEHSVRVARQVMKTHPHYEGSKVMYCHVAGGKVYSGNDLVYQALMHDSTEAYICDMARPFKHLPEFKFYIEVEDALMKVISKAFEFDYPFHPAIKAADEVLLGTEARDLMSPVVEGWHFRYDHLPETIRPWSPRFAKARFLDLFNVLAPAHLRTTACPVQ